MSPEGSDTGAAAAVYEFLVRYLEDQENGSVQSLEQYQALFPGQEEVIAKKHAELRGGRDSEIRCGDGEALDRLGRFRLLRELGRGGQAVVYLAEDTSLRRRVALKVLTGTGAFDADRLSRFVREAEVASRLDHPGICAVHDSGIESGQAYIVMRYVEGETLAHRIQCERQAATAAAEGRPSTTRARRALDVALALFEKTARALHVAHEAGVIHCDVKPGNIMITGEDEPVLLDFGLARDTESDLALTRSGDVFGTPAYMSPEQLEGSPLRLDRRTDVYSLGAALYECVTLSPPFEAPTREALYQVILTSPTPDPRRLNPAIPRDLRVVLETALEKNRDRRYQTAHDLAEELRAVREHRPIRARPLSMPEKLARWARREPARASLLLVLMVALPLIGGLAVYLFSTRETVAVGVEANRRQKIESLLDEGFSHCLDLNRPDAAEAFEKALEVNPREVLALCGLALARWKLFYEVEEPEAALSWLQEREAPFRGDEEFLWFKVFFLQRARREADAERLKEKLGPYPGSLWHFMEGVVRALSSGRGRLGLAQEAYIHFRQAALTSAPRLIFYCFGARAAVACEEDEDTVRSWADALVKNWPESSQAWYYRGLALWGTSGWRHDPEGAVLAWKQALVLDETNYAARHGLARHHFEKDRYEAAIADFLKVLKISENADGAWALMGRAKVRLQKLDEGIRDIRKAIEIREEPRHYCILAEALLRDERAAEAERAAGMAIELDPYDSFGHYQLASALWAQKKNLDQAVESLRAAINYYERWPDYHDLLAEILFHQKEYKEALRRLERTLELRIEQGADDSILARLRQRLEVYRKAAGRL